ncbi:unnamed protein product [Cylicocyclus nassatus]|uniref:Uncharacterized protein n=1 Tax=Cylicocyclus nassatus TaxID=53992 RepID=A0AA36H198_CYLNA|nr:unnamed protein product [Cylicocyclus nassatus]
MFLHFPMLTMHTCRGAFNQPKVQMVMVLCWSIRSAFCVVEISMYLTHLLYGDYNDTFWKNKSLANECSTHAYQNSSRSNRLL